LATTTGESRHDVIGVRVARGQFRDDLRAVGVVWRRELIRFSRNRIRILTACAQPVVFLFILGTGLSSVVPVSAPNFSYRTFLFPGVVAMTLLFTAIFSAVSIVWDREFGFLREMLVAPVRRSAIVWGKALGGATVATAQGAIMLALMGLVHVPYSLELIVTMLLMMMIVAFMLTAIGLMLAARMEQVESFQVVIQFFVMPMFFLSGAVFPLSHLPRWLAVLTKIDPLTYGVDPLRRDVFAHLNIPAVVTKALDPGVHWGSWRLPTWFELALVVAVGLAALTVAVVQFSKTD
jgi:ABC-2 type transport system permease protein